MTETLLVLFIFAILVEAITNIVKTIYKKDEGIQLPVIISMAIAIILSIVYGQDLFTAFGFTSAYPIVGYILTGIIYSRGANVVSDLIYRLQNPIEKKEIEQNDEL